MKTSFQNIIDDFRKFLRVIWRNFWLILILFLLIDFLSACFCFWHYFLKAEKREIKIYSHLKLNRKLLDAFSNELETRDKAFQKSLEEEHLDIFNPR